MSADIKAQNWLYAFRTNDNSKIYIQKYSYKNSSDSKYWIKTVGKSIEYYSAKLRKNIKIAGSSIVLWDINCNEKKYAILTGNTYNSKGSLVDNFKVSENLLEWKYTFPDTNGEILINFACNLLGQQNVELDTAAAK